MCVYRKSHDKHRIINVMIENIYYFFENHPRAGLLLCTWLGALFGHMLSLYDTSFNGCRSFLSRVIPEKKDVYYDRLELILLPVIGCVLAYLLLDPSNMKSATFAGLTWSGTLIAILKRGNSK